VDCSALVPTLIEAELFGHVKGAFPGAAHTKQGLMESADTGTLFLDEIGELPTDLQAKLLRAIQEKEIRPVGATDRIPVASRVIAATNRDLETMIRQSTFRQDLYFRLNVVQIKLPALRERKTDIPILVNAFLEKRNVESGRAYQFTEAAMSQLLAYDWPGNVRELENAVERATALNSGPLLDLADLPSNVAYTMNHRPPMPDEIMPLEELERRAILHALHEASGDRMEAPKLLKIGKTTLYRKLKQYEAEASRLGRRVVSTN
jgi:transcriptional regulator with PAS, ATPase and Fis domain